MKLERVIVIARVAEAPWLTVSAPVLADRLKFAPAFTVRLRLVERVPMLPVPLIVTFTVPGVALAEAANVTVLVLPVVGSGLKAAVTPAGQAARASRRSR